MEMKQRRSNKYIWLFFIGISVLASVSKIFVGFDIDEGYAIALPYRFLQGDRLLTDMWEVHQTSAIFAAWLIKPFLIISGTTEGIVLYSRIVSTVLHLLISVFCYYALSRYVSKAQAGFLALIYYNFLPKWMMNVDFSMQFSWFFILVLLCILMGEASIQKQKEKQMYIWLFLAGVSLALLVLGYPTMVLLYPVYVIGIWRRESWKKEDRTKAIWMLTGGCAVLAIAFLVYLLTYMNVSEIFENIPHVFSDGSHQFSGSSKWSLWIGHLKDVILQTAITVLPAMLLAGVLTYVVKKKTEFPFSVLLTNVYVCLTSAIVIFAEVFGISWGPFRLQIRYIVMFVFAFFLIPKIEDRKKAGWVWFCIVSTLVAFLSILFASNVGPTSSSSYLVLGIMAVLWILMEYVEQMKKSGQCTTFLKVGTFMTLVLFLLSLLFCKGFYIRVTGYLPSNICMERKQITEGPAKGIFVSLQEYDEMTETYEIMQQYAGGEDKVLYLGTQALNNLYTQGKMVIPTTISTPAFNEQWIEYFEMYPEKRPTVIFLSKTTVDNQEKFFEQNAFGIWIAQNYDVENRVDAEFVCVIQ